EEFAVHDAAKASAIIPLHAFLARPLGHVAMLTGVLAIVAGAWGGWLGDGSWAGHPWLHAYTAVAATATAFLLAWVYEAIALTWLGSAVILVGLIHFLGWSDDQGMLVRLGVIGALLTHATCMGLAGTVMRPSRQAVSGILAVPLWQSALVTSILAVPL